MTSLSQTVQGALRYRGGEHQLSYIGHRISGLGVLFFLALHILDTATVYFIPSLYRHAIELYRTTAMMIGEMVLVVAVISHGVNGIRIALSDFFPDWWQEKQQRRGFWFVAAITVLLAAPAVFMMARNVYLHNICQCATESTLSRDLPLWVSIGVTLSLALALIVLARVGTFQALFSRRPRNFETWMWLFMRWSAILLVPLVWIHVLFVDVLFGVHNIDLDYVQLRWATVGWRVYDFALLAFAFAHGMNGLRNVMQDYVHTETWQRRLSWGILAAWVVISIIGAVALVGGARSA
jgi:succinate dehydrogenase cytochrome b556 subunit